MAETGPGRPTLFTEETRQKIIKAVRGGNYNYIAAAAAGVNKSTLRNWMARGRKEEDGEYADFLAALTKAEQEAEIEAVDGVRLAAKQDPKQWHFWLERKCPERWGRDTYQIKQLEKEINELKIQVQAVLGAGTKRGKKAQA